MPLLVAGQFTEQPGFFTIAQFAKGGIITLAQFVYGVVFIGQFGFGFFSVSQFGFGFLNITTTGFGIINIALAGIGLLVSYGGGALGFIAVGEEAVGYYHVSGTSDLYSTIVKIGEQIYVNPYPFCYWIIFLGILFTYIWIMLNKFNIIRSNKAIQNS